MKTITLKFNGYWREVDKGGVPNQSGIYCVYSCIYNASEKTVRLLRLLYIGESENVRERLINHERLQDWQNALQKGETICYSFAAINENDRERAEAALIYKIKPPFNTEHSRQFNYYPTEIIVEGETRFLLTRFTVQ